MQLLPLPVQLAAPLLPLQPVGGQLLLPVLQRQPQRLLQRQRPLQLRLQSPTSTLELPLLLQQQQ